MSEARTFRRERKKRTLTNLFRNNPYPKAGRWNNRPLCKSEIADERSAASAISNACEQDATDKDFLLLSSMNSTTD